MKINRAIAFVGAVMIGSTGVSAAPPSEVGNQTARGHTRISACANAKNSAKLTASSHSNRVISFSSCDCVKEGGEYNEFYTCSVDYRYEKE